MTEIERILAREAIKDAKARYCRLMDTKQWDAWGEVFTPDVEMDVTDDVKTIPGAATIVRGRDTIVQQTRALTHPAQIAHQVHHPEITFVSDTEAEATWAMEDFASFTDDIPAPFKSKHGFGYYYDTFKFHEGAWRIAKLKLSRIVQTIVPRG